jgi:hypothetical protein
MKKFSVPDPNPDPHVFWPPGSGSNSQRHGSADPIRIRIHTKMSWIRNTEKIFWRTLKLTGIYPSPRTNFKQIQQQFSEKEHVERSVADPGCLSRNPDPDFIYPRSWIQDPGSRIPGSHISDPTTKESRKKIVFLPCF